MKVFLGFVPKREGHIAGPERVAYAWRKERRACFTQITRRHTAVLFSIYALLDRLDRDTLCNRNS